MCSCFTCMVLTSFSSLVSSWRVEPWRFQVSVGRGLPVARHPTDTGSPILTRRGPAGVSCTLGATGRKETQTWAAHKSWLFGCLAAGTGCEDNTDYSSPFKVKWGTYQAVVYLHILQLRSNSIIWSCVCVHLSNLCWLCFWSLLTPEGIIWLLVTKCSTMFTS